jgi:tellurite resistance protein
VPPNLLNFANLFDGLKGRGADGEIDVPTAIMIPLVAAMLADGWVEDEELLEIQSICASSPIFSRNSRSENEHLVALATRMIQDDGFEKSIARSVRVLTPALRETAFVHAIRVIFSDGYVSKSERETVENMIEWLQIDHGRARVMVEIVSVMQHPNTA